MIGDVDQGIAGADLEIEIGLQQGRTRLGIEIGIADQHIDISGKLAGKIEFHPAAARLTDRNREARIAGVAGQHVVLVQLEHRQRPVEPPAKRRYLHPHLGGGARFRVEDRAVDIRADIGAKALAISGIERQWRADLINDPGLRAEPSGAALAVDPGQAVERAQADIVITATDADLQAIRQTDLVLHEKPAGSLHIEPIVLRARGRQRKAAIDRIENVDDVAGLLRRIAAERGRAEAAELLVVVELVMVRADQNAVAQGTRFERAGQFRADDPLLRIIAARTALARQRAPVPEHLLARGHQFRIGRKARQQRIAQARADQHAPVIAEIVLHAQLLAGRTRDVVAIARLAQKTGERHRVEITVQNHDTAIERGFDARIFEVIGQACAVPDRKTDRGQEAPAPLIDLVAERIPAFAITDEARGKAISQRKIEVGLSTKAVETAILHRRAAERASEFGLLGHQIDRAARFAPTKHGCRRSLEHFDPFDPGNIARTAKPAPAVEAVDEVSGRDVLVPGKAAHSEAVEQSAQRILPRHRCVEIQCIGEAQEVVLRDRHVFDRGNRLRNFAQGKVAAIGLPHARDQDFVRCRFAIGLSVADSAAAFITKTCALSPSRGRSDSRRTEQGCRQTGAKEFHRYSRGKGMSFVRCRKPRLASG